MMSVNFVVIMGFLASNESGVKNENFFLKLWNCTNTNTLKIHFSCSFIVDCFSKYTSMGPKKRKK
jgi:hypothetical protein